MRAVAARPWKRALAALSALALAVTGTALAAVPAQAAPGDVSGTVVLPPGADDAWLAGIEINLWNDDLDSYTGPDPQTGEYSFEDVPAGTYWLVAWPYGYWDDDVLVQPNLVPLQFEVEVPEGGLTGLDLELELGYSLSGTITLPAGITERAFEGMNVSVDGENGGYGWASVDPETGEYTVSGLTADSYRVQVLPGPYLDGDLPVQPNLMPEYWQDAHSYEDASPVLVEGGDVTGIDFVLDKGATISGKVTLAAGTTLQAGEFLQVSADHLYEGASQTAIVNPATGAYTLAGLLPGEYILRFEGTGTWDEEGIDMIPSLIAPEFYNNVYTYSEATPVEAVGAVKGINAQLAKGRTISGKVTVPAGTPAGWYQGVEVSAQIGDEFSFDSVSWTGLKPDGTYTLTALPPVDVVVGFDVYGYWDEVTEQEVELNLLSEYYKNALSREDATVVKLGTGDKTGINASLEAGMTISGTVTPADGVSPEVWAQGVSVWVESADGSVESTGAATVDPETGEYRIQGLAPVEHLVQFSGDGSYDWESGFWQSSRLVTEWWDDALRWEDADLVDLAGGSATGIDAELDEGLSITGQVTVPEGTDARWTQAVYASASSSTGGASTYTSLEADGSYELVGLPSDAYVVYFEVGEVWDEDSEEPIPVDLVGEYFDNAQCYGDATEVVVDGADVNGVDAALTADGPGGKPCITLTDIAGNPFEQEITWLAEAGITTGWDNQDGTWSFRPLVNVNRDVMAAFLYRLAGADFVGPSVSPFKDVSTSHVFYDEIAWLSEAGISEGWEVKGGREFRPTVPVNRDVMAAFLYRFAGEPEFEAPATSPFKDVTTAHVFYDEISWLAESQISEGWSVKGGREFRPAAPVKRDVMAAFLYRFASYFA